MRIKLATLVALCLLAGVLGSSYAFAIGGTEKVVAKGDEAKAVPGWPEGVLKLTNDPLRVDGWHPWFSECPNDSYFYGMDVGNPGDINHLIEVLGSIDAKTLHLNLDPGEGAPHAGGAGAVFVLGNQPIVDAWYKALRETEPGVRAFGVHRYREPPAAQPPTLTIYVGHKAVELNKLQVPLNIDLTTANAKSYRERYQKAFEEIDEFVASHKAKQDQSRNGASNAK
jgi:hypothetical protein